MQENTFIERQIEIMRNSGKKIPMINEGIDIDYKNLLVAFNPSHEMHVDTSIKNNPTYTEEYGEEVKVWSIFKRKNDTVYDGNPLLYAMKNEKGWKFRSQNDKNEIYKQFELIAEKFSHIYNAGFTIILPSGNNLNKTIGDVIGKKCEGTVIVDDVLTKITTEEVMDSVLTPKSPFIMTYWDNIEQALRRLQGYLNKMDRLRNGFFTRHFVSDGQMRDVLTMALKVSEDIIGRYYDCINGKDILLIDDSISRGQTIKEAISIINETYDPNSITVLTLFSKAY